VGILPAFYVKINDEFDWINIRDKPIY